jgi:gliding motility-associated-like protein/uncharacterized repeat protein (TIGR01451 family)
VDSDTFTAVYTLTQSDIDAGTFTNTATATGQYNGDVTDTDEDVQNFVRTASISIVKTADKTAEIQVGDIITYTYVVTNTGNVTVNGVDVTDIHPGTGTLGELITTDATDGILPGGTVTYMATYTVTQQDIDNNIPITNTATATAMGINNVPAVANDTATITPEKASASILLEKTGLFKDVNNNGRADAGDQINYTFTITNTGNVNLTNVIVTDPKVTVIGTPIALLGAGKSDGNTFTAVYTLTQSDIDAGTFTNTATATGQYNGDVTDTDEDVQVFLQVPSLVLSKTADKSSVSAAGEQIVYTLTVTNTGNVTIDEVTLVDAKVSVNKNVGSLAPGASATVTATYTVSQADMDAGSIVNVASVSGTDPKGVDTDTEDGVTVNVAQNAFLSLSKTANKSSVSGAGDEIVYTLTVTNTGNVTITDINKSDPKVSYNKSVGTLSPGQSASVDIVYVVTQSDIDSGQIANTGFITGNGPGGITISGEDVVTVNVNQVGALSVVKTSDSQNYSVIGQEIVYTIRVTNTGNVTLNNILIRDPLTGLENTVNTLAPGISVNIETAYLVKLEDLVKGSILNNVFVSGKLPDGGDVSGSDSISITGESNQIIANDDNFGERTISFVGLLGNILENDLLEGRRPDPNDVDFEFTELDGIIGLNIAGNGDLSLSLIEPLNNEAREYTLRYVLREKLNPTNSDTGIVTFRLVDNTTDLSVTKTSNEAEVFEGDEFEYVITVRNVGSTDATEVMIVDDLPTGISYVGSTFTSNNGQIGVNTSVQGSRITWDVPFFPQGGILVITLKVKAGALSGENPLIITNGVSVSAKEVETNPSDNSDSDVNRVNPFFIPNVITPDGDGKNDTFEIKGLNKFVQNEIVIFNRNGDHVFKQSNYENGWDAQGLVAGTYFYVLTGVDSQGKKHDFKGWIQVIKKDGSTINKIF